MSRPIKFRYACKDLGGEVFFYYLNLDEILNGFKGFGAMGRIEEIIGRDQFTGLKDRNGREIYEGDIVRLTLGDVPLIAHVKWEHFSWYFLETVGGFPLCNIPDCLEVIGNIHEHAELLQ